MAEKNKQTRPSAFSAFDRYERGETDGVTPAEQEFSGYGSYLFGSSYADPSASGSQEAPPPNWSSYTSSRIVVRLFSRGLMGSTFYTIANRWVPVQLRGYTAEGMIDPQRPLQYIARGFDIVYGKPIQAAVGSYYRMAGKSAEEVEALAWSATNNFRSKRNFKSPIPPAKVLRTADKAHGGRSLGAEIVGITTDFAAGSTGDAWGRQIANMFDPNFKNSWEREDGSTDYRQFARAVGRNAWQIFSKNQGEDWVAALPYVYQMRFQRQAIDKMYRGFSVTSDHQFNGGSWRMNPQGEIVDSYAKAGALDLQARFTGYNIYTLMYRDFYDMVAQSIRHWRGQGDAPSFLPKDEPHDLIDYPAQLARYVAKSAMKATLYMTPAVPFFWVTRTPQTKPHGLGIVMDEHGNIRQELKPRPVDPFAVEHTRGVFDRLTNPFGKMCYESAKGVNKVLRYFGASESMTMMGPQNKTFAEDFVNASASYTPYMIAKAETALRWDRPKDRHGLNEMDRAIYRLIDGVAKLDLGQIKAGLGDIREEMIRPPSNHEIEKKSKALQKELARNATASASAEEQSSNNPQGVIPGHHVKDATLDASTLAADKTYAVNAEPPLKASYAAFVRERNVPDGVTIH